MSYSIPHKTFSFMNLLDELQKALNPNTISQLREHIGAESDEQTETAANGILSTLVAGLSKNAKKPDQMSAMVSAIDLDHDGEILDDLGSFLFGKRQTQNPKTLNGPGILGHVLGSNQARTTDMMRKVTGLNNGQITKLLVTLAPLVLAVLGRARRKDNLDTDGVGDILRKSVDPKTTPRKEMGLLERFLDKNGDGKVMDDILNMGKGVFSRR